MLNGTEGAKLLEVGREKTGEHPVPPVAPMSEAPTAPTAPDGLVMSPAVRQQMNSSLHKLAAQEPQMPARESKDASVDPVTSLGRGGNRVLMIRKVREQHFALVKKKSK